MGNGETLEQLAGQIVNVVYQNGENGYGVLRVRTVDGDSITAVGCFPGASAGEDIIMEGRWVSHAAYGQQFKAERAERKLPSSRRAIYDYLASGAVKGIGPATAAAVINLFGEDALDIIESEPERLAEIKGISKKKAVQIGADFKKGAHLRRFMEFFGSYGLNPALAVKAYKCYGEEGIEVIKDNPYILTDDYFGADFFEADTLALGMGISEDSPKRVEAAVLFELRHNLINGHTFLPYQKLIMATGQLIGQEQDIAEEALMMLCDSGYVVRDTVAGQDACYLENVHEAETYIAARILSMAKEENEDAGKIERLLTRVEKKEQIEYAPLQREAIKAAGESTVFVLTGGPGTGKTTAVKGILSLFEAMGLETALAAPTGRAAKRLSELTGEEAQTIHRLLGAGYTPESSELSFERCESDPLDAEAVIIDEMSMVDVMLMESLLRAMRPGTRLVLVGDADQLPPVGPGNVFSDIIRSEAVRTVKLTEIFRQAEKSRIVQNAHKINGGIIPSLNENKGDFFFLQRPTKGRIVDTVVELCSQRLPKNMGFEPWQIQVLSPGRKHESGTINLNKCLQAAVNPPSPDKKEKQYGEFIFREGDRVMQIHNNYDIMWKKADGLGAGMGIFNGDIGKILSIDNQQETLTVNFDDRIALYPFDMLSEIEPAYAMTVHKSQGSEYRAVILAAGKTAPALMTRSILYTAVTRAREMLIIVGDSECVCEMIRNDRRQKRYSGLKTRLSKGE